MKPKIAFFDFASCEGCQLEALNLYPEELLDIAAAVDIVNFREAMSERSDDYDIAFVEGSITREADMAQNPVNPQTSQNIGCFRGLCLYRRGQLSKKPDEYDRCAAHCLRQRRQILRHN